MKNKHWPNTVTSLVMAMFILSLFSGITAAQTPGEQYKKDKEQYRIHKEKYERTKEKFWDAKEQFEKALKRLNNAKDNKSSEELKQKARDYFGRAIDHIAAHLEVLKYRAELAENRRVFPFDASTNIDALLEQLDETRVKAQQANTVQEFKEANKELKELWVKIKLETRYDFALVLEHRIDTFITKANNVSTRLDAAIGRLKSQGRDTTKLEKDAADYRNLVSEAKDNQVKVNDLIASHNGFAADGTVTNIENARAFLNQAESLQKETIKKLRAATRQLQDFVRDFRKLSGEKAVNGMKKSEDRSNENKRIVGNMAVTGSVTPEGNRED